MTDEQRRVVGQPSAAARNQRPATRRLNPEPLNLKPGVNQFPEEEPYYEQKSSGRR
jgi:hypothetical protein